MVVVTGLLSMRRLASRYSVLYPIFLTNALAWYCASADMYLEESLQAAQRAAALEPENSGILDTLAEVLFRLGRKKEAIEVIDRAIAIDPDDDYLRGQKARFEQK